MTNFADLSGFYTLLWIVLMFSAVILLICKRIALRKQKEKLADLLGRIGRICAISGAAALLFSVFALMGGLSEYFAKGH